MFITIQDYATVCDERELEVLQNADNTIRESAEKVALDEVASYLRTRYDVQKTYSQTGDERNAYLVQIVANIALYYLSKRLPQKMAGQKRAELYDQAIDWLKLVGSGKAMPDLPVATTPDGKPTTGFPVLMDSLPRQKYDW